MFQLREFAVYWLALLLVLASALELLHQCLMAAALRLPASYFPQAWKKTVYRFQPRLQYLTAFHSRWFRQSRRRSLLQQPACLPALAISPALLQPESRSLQFQSRLKACFGLVYPPVLVD